MRAALLGIISPVLSFEQRRWLRAFLDFTAREQIAERMPSAPRCRGCGAWLHERTPGCSHCTERHWCRRRRNRQLAAELRLPNGRSRSARARWANGDDAASGRLSS